MPARDRHTGVLLPLFSAVSTTSWGIGELPDVGPLARWIASAGGDRLMLLPIGTMAEGETSPYSACSAMAIDPIYIGVEAVPDFAEAGGRSRLTPEALETLDRLKVSERVDYAAVRRLKGTALEVAFGRFVDHQWEPRGARGSALRAYIDRERWWLDDYALFQALSEAHSGNSWRDWPPALRDRDSAALEEARTTLARPVLRHQYLQWLAEEQWQAARGAADQAGVAIFGDLPFVVNLHSADVWARADEFLLDVTVGVPPDAFSETGQDWGLPAYRWEVIAARGYQWLRQRARRMSALFSGFRIDHVIGFYRTYGRPARGEPFFAPGEEADQIAQGEAVLRIFSDTGAALIAEDLGTVPDFLRPSLARLGVAGCKVLRWEREWKAPDQPFIDPASFPPMSCALTSTHDTHTLADWWDTAGPDERAALLQLPLFQTRGVHDPSQPWSDMLRDLLLEFAWTSGSVELLSAVQDLFGWRDRINLPATVGGHNWTWRMPWAVDRLADVAEASERAAFCRELTDRYRKA